MTQEQIEIIANILRTIFLVIFYMALGLGPGFIVGMLLANRIIGKNNPHRMDVHQEKIEQAIQHNKQWDPSNDRWQKP